ncbi:class I SAM-dependent methyltransferase [Phenylobacterium sp.]|uniref:class I SAM-dependent methyltransferase n=1 Tax=Phenylobacterium sp. TaxID=1871053 RepID=UPI0025E49D15|nr:class I SAM-dependent methyltransferase [Phenylobacterium sp.]
MAEATSDATNTAQVEYWNTAAGPTWAELQAPLDRQLAPLGRAAMDALRPAAGERILDIGCGAGATSLDLARTVAPGGWVIGVDISRPLLAAARQRAAGVEGLSFVEADAQSHTFAAESFDAVFSRFGVMFFADPTAAFANIRRAVKPGGRLAFICWRTPAENPIMTLPAAAAQPFLPPPPPPPPAGTPGPFAFADPDRVRAILADAGWTDARVAPHDVKTGAGDLDAFLALALRVGPLGGLLRENPDQREVVIDAVRTTLKPHEGPQGILLDSATWIVTARA